MKDNLLFYSLIIGVLIGCGCTSKQNVTGPYSSGEIGLQLLKSNKYCREINSETMWQFKKEGKFSSLQEADRYVSNLELGGYDDWRLPSKRELYNLFYIFYRKKNNDCIMNVNGDFWITPNNQEATLGHWEVYHLCGPEYKFVESIKAKGYVRAIRP